MTHQQPELKSCPFCGYAAMDDYSDIDGGLYSVHCKKCDGSYYANNIHDAINGWNTRADPVIDDNIIKQGAMIYNPHTYEVKEKSVIDDVGGGRCNGMASVEGATPSPPNIIDDGQLMEAVIGAECSILKMRLAPAHQRWIKTLIAHAQRKPKIDNAARIAILNEMGIDHQMTVNEDGSPREHILTHEVNKGFFINHTSLMCAIQRIPIVFTLLGSINEHRALVEVTTENLYREMTCYGGREIDWSKPVAAVLKNISKKYPNGLKIIKGEKK